MCNDMAGGGDVAMLIALQQSDTAATALDGNIPILPATRRVTTLSVHKTWARAVRMYFEHS